MGDQIFTELKMILERSLQSICRCTSEKTLQNILNAQLRGKKRVLLESDKYPKVEIDLLGNAYAIEIKYNEKYYAGLSQILAQKTLYKLNNLILIHVTRYSDSKFVQAYQVLANTFQYSAVLVDTRNKRIHYFNWKQ